LLRSLHHIGNHVLEILTGETNVGAWVVVKKFGQTPTLAAALATIIVLDSERLDPICIFVAFIACGRC
jgi:hypothetical protein